MRPIILAALCGCAGQATTGNGAVKADVSAMLATIDELTDRLEATEARLAAVEATVVPVDSPDDEGEPRQAPGTVLEVIDCRDFADAGGTTVHYWSVDILTPLRPVGWMLWTENLGLDIAVDVRWRFSIPTSPLVEPVACDPNNLRVHYRVAI